MVTRTKAHVSSSNDAAPQNGAANGSQEQHVAIKPPNMPVASFTITGTSPLVMNRFSAKAKQQIHDTQEAGSTARSKKQRAAKDFQACYESAIHRSTEGWVGIPATSLRASMISACSIVGFHMTKGKKAIFVLADGYEEDGTPLVRITKGEPRYFESCVRLDSGPVDLRARPKFDPGWQAVVRVQFDADMFTLSDMTNLLARAGMQVGILEGRPDSKKSYGQGWGLFSVGSAPSK